MSYLKVKNVTFKYPNGYKALDDVSMEFSKGEVVAIIGQNGAGKTTLMKLLNGLYKPTSGDIEFDGNNTKDYTTAKIAKDIGYVFQNPDDQIFNNEVKKEIEFGPKRLKLAKDVIKKQTNDAIRLTRLKNHMYDHPYNLPFSIRKFITIASVIAVNPEVFILDEPTAGQDSESMDLIGKLIKELASRGKTVIVITHDMSFVTKYFERVIVMANTRVVCDSTAREVFWNEDVLRQSCLKQTYMSSLASKIGLEDSKILNYKELANQLVGEG